MFFTMNLNSFYKSIACVPALTTASAYASPDQNSEKPPIYSFYVDSASSSKPNKALSKFIEAADTESKPVTKEQWLAFSTKDQKPFDLGKGYSNNLGWTLWKSRDTSLFEVTSLTAPAKNEYNKDDFTVLYDPTTGKFDKVSLEEYSNWGLKTRLGIASGDNPETSAREGSAILMSIRDSFSYFNANQEGFGFDYTNTNGESTMNIKGALMLDFYLDPLYNRTNNWFGDGNPYQFWFRTGVEFDRDDTAAKPFDRTSYYFLTNFQANPDQSARLLGSDSLINTFSPQFLQVGAALDHDDFTGETDLRWIIGWQPQFYLPKDIIPGWGESFGINRIMRYRKGSPFNLLKPSDIAENPPKDAKEDPASPWYSSLPMDLKLSGGSELLADAFKNDADSAEDALLEWKAGVFFGNSDWRARCGYFIEGASPVIDPGETHIGHRIVAEVGIGNISEETRGKQRSQIEAMKKDDKSYEHVELSSSDLGAMTIFAEYRFGAPAPTYRKEEIFQIGTRIRF